MLYYHILTLHNPLPNHTSSLCHPFLISSPLLFSPLIQVSYVSSDFSPPIPLLPIAPSHPLPPHPLPPSPPPLPFPCFLSSPSSRILSPPYPHFLPFTSSSPSSSPLPSSIPSPVATYVCMTLRSLCICRSERCYSLCTGHSKHKHSQSSTHLHLYSGHCHCHCFG